MKTMKITLYVQYSRTMGIQVYSCLLQGNHLIEEQEIEVEIPDFDEEEAIVEAIKSEIDAAKAVCKERVSGLELELDKLEGSKCQK